MMNVIPSIRTNSRITRVIAELSPLDVLRRRGFQVQKICLFEMGICALQGLPPGCLFANALDTIDETSASPRQEKSIVTGARKEFACVPGGIAVLPFLSENSLIGREIIRRA